jgi:glycosyltransferase involved in cell wall biosynthesis
MEILFVSHKHPPFTGGMEKQSFELVNGMKRYAKVHSIVYEGKENKIRFFLLLKKRIYKYCRLHPGISVIHYNDGLIAAWCRHFKRYPHIRQTVTLHGLDVVFPNIFYRRFILPSFNRFHLVVAVSSGTAKAAINRGILPEKIITIANGVDTSISDTTGLSSDFATHFKKQYGQSLEQRKIIVAMGRPVKRKGFSWFIKEVLPLLQEETLFLLIGPFKVQETMGSKILRSLPTLLRTRIELLLGLPSDQHTIRQLLAITKEKQNVMHLGRLPFSSIQQVLHAAHAFVMPNLPVYGDMEGFGLVCLEACLCGATVFAANIDGIPDAIHHQKNGYLLPADNAEIWAATLQRFLQQDTSHNTEAIAYTKEHFSWDKMVKAYYEAFLSLTNS